MSQRYRAEFDRVFGKKFKKQKPKPFDNRDLESMAKRTNRDTHEPVRRIYDVEKGREVKLNDWQKNRIYSRAKELKESLKGSLLSKDECWNPTEANVAKMRKNEFSTNRKMAWLRYKDSMRAIGAEPSDYNQDRLRR